MVVVIAGVFLFRAVKYGGIRAATFGTRIDKTLGEVDLPRNSFVSRKVRVHVLRNETEQVGREFVARSALSWQMVPFSLSKAEATELITLLQRAVAGG